MKKKKSDNTLLLSILGVIVIISFLVFIDKIFPPPDINADQFIKPIEVSHFYDVYPNYTGKVVVLVFSDFECPFCARNHPTTKMIREEYKDKIVFEYKHFPLTDMHPYALNAAIASECARDQNKFWEYHDMLFEKQKLSIDDLNTHAKDLSLDMTQFSSCLQNQETLSRVEADFQEGVRLGVDGTPSLFVNGEKLVGGQAYGVLSKLIDEALA